jgi:hypothetical protein
MLDSEHDYLGQEPTSSISLIIPPIDLGYGSIDFNLSGTLVVDASIADSRSGYNPKNSKYLGLPEGVYFT